MMRLLGRIAHEGDGDGRSSIVESIPVYPEGGKQVISLSHEKYPLRLANHPFFPSIQVQEPCYYSLEGT
jgi:hypothetical protein